MLKKILSVFLLLFAVMAIVACSTTKYTVSFDADGGTPAPTDQLISKGKKATRPINPTKDGYNIDGWYLDGEEFLFDERVIEEDITLKARWKIKSFKVTFNDYDGSTFGSPVNVDWGNDAVPPVTDPTREGYVFLKWDVDYTNVKKDLVVTAEYEAITRTITFDTVGGNTIDLVSYTYPERTVAPADPEKDDKTFAGWFTDANYTTAFSFGSELLENITIYAKWSDYFAIVFETNGGNSLNPISEAPDTDISSMAPTPVKEGHSFDGWYTNAGLTDKYTFGIMPERNLKLYAKWKINEYQVTFKDFDGQELKKQTVEWNKGATAPANPDNRPDFIFSHWDVSFDKITKDLVVTAVYAPDEPRFVEWYDLPSNAKYNGGKVEVVFWHRMGEANQTMVQGWIEEFEAIYPNITVVEEKAADDYDQLVDKAALAIPAGNQPDIIESYPDHVARYGKAALSLNNFVNNPNIGFSQEEIDDFLTGLWNEGSSYDKAGTIMSLPFTKSSEAFFYNKTYFDKHGYTLPERGYWTWNEIFAIAEDIKSREPHSIPFGYDSSDNMFITMSEQWNAPYTGYDENGVGEVLFNNDDSKTMVAYFKDKVDRGLMTTRGLSGAYTSDRMKLGEAAAAPSYMFVGSTGGTRYAIDGTKLSINQYQVGVAPVPVRDTDNRKQIQQGPNISLFRNTNQQKMIAAWLFAKFMLEPERTAAFGIQSGYAPVRHSAYETTVWNNYVSSIKAVPANHTEAVAKLIKESIELFRDNEDIFFTSAVFGRSSKARNEVGKLLNKIFAYEGANLDNFIKKEYEDAYYYVVN